MKTLRVLGAMGVAAGAVLLSAWLKRDFVVHALFVGLWAMVAIELFARALGRLVDDRLVHLVWAMPLMGAWVVLGGSVAAALATPLVGPADLNLTLATVVLGTLYGTPVALVVGELLAVGGGVVLVMAKKAS